MEKKFLSMEKLVGKQVIDSEGVIVGTVKDVSFDLEAREIALIVATRAGAEVTISNEDISQVGDVILLNKVIELPKPTVSPSIPSRPAPPTVAPRVEAGNVCPSCGHLNDSLAKFCIKCGTKLG